MARFKHPPEMKRKALRMFKEGMTSYAVSVVLEISSSTAIRWQDEMGFGPDRRTPGARKRPIPDDLAQQAEYHGSLQRLCSHYHSSDSTVRRWLKESGIVLATRAPSDAKTPLPTWWEDAGKMTKAEIKERANVSYKVVDRWLRETGVTPRRAPKAVDLMNVMGKANRVSVSGGLTLLDHAANHLRRAGYSNVHRADLPLYEGRSTTWGDAHGVPRGGKDHYVVGRLGAMHARQMVALAVQHGWSAAW